MSGDKSLIFKLILLVIFIIISLRLFYLQIYEDKYHELSENNTVHLIFWRDHKVFRAF